MINLNLREQRLTAELVRQRLRMNYGARALMAAGIEVRFRYEGETIWLEVGYEVVSCIAWPQWWEAGLATREDRAIEVTRRLVRGVRR